MRPIFCGNFEYDARQSELERLFKKYGRVERVDMKSGFAFIYMEDERDADDAIRGLDRIEFGRKGRRLRVEWTKNERGVRKPMQSRRSSGNTRPSKTLFVINFDPYNTRTRDLEKHFDPYGKIVSVRIRRNFAFVQYESQEDSIKALEATNMSKLMDRVISVEYAARDDDEKKNGSPDRMRDRSPDRRKRSLSPYRSARGSPDYGRGSSPSYRRERGSPDYGRDRSPYRRDKVSPDFARGRRERDHGSRSPDGRGPRDGRDLSHSPYHREKDNSKLDLRAGSTENGRNTPDKDNENDHARSPSPFERERVGAENGHQRRSPEDDNDHNPMPEYEGSESPTREAGEI